MLEKLYLCISTSCAIKYRDFEFSALVLDLRFWLLRCIIRPLWFIHVNCYHPRIPWCFFFFLNDYNVDNKLHNTWNLRLNLDWVKSKCRFAWVQFEFIIVGSNLSLFELVENVFGGLSNRRIILLMG